MKDVYKSLFKLIIVCAIITLVFGEIFFLNLIAVTGQISNKTYQEAQDLTASGEEVNDMAGYGALFDYLGSGFTKIIQIVFIFLSIALFVFVTIYLLLYYIAGRQFKNGESKDKMTISIILVSIALLMKMYFIFKFSEIIITDFNILFNFESILILLPYISEIVSVIFTIIFYFKNSSKIERIYNERIEEKNEN